MKSKITQSYVYLCLVSSNIDHATSMSEVGNKIYAEKDVEKKDCKKSKQRIIPKLERST